MLKTPANFIPEHAARTAADPLNLVFCAGRLLLRAHDMGFPDSDACRAAGAADASWHAVGTLAGRYCHTATLAPDAVAPHGLAFFPLRALFDVIDDELLGLVARAAQIAEWARTHRYCGACGAPMLLVAGERCYKCSVCTHLAYPRISPAMMVLIRKGDAVLLALHSNSPSKRFSPLAGFLEAGESIEEAVHREVFEEVGLRVHNLRYFMSQTWPFPHSLMIAFTADYLDGEIRVDANEIAEARWFGPDDVWPEPASTVSISALLVDAHRPPPR